ncbi:MAG: beta-ketoacyl-ACP synthase II [Anaerolineae bacterium]|jgi:3-oxoacyl-[acyl-carrier-protein] synthase II|nr:beta-ketoacyl-ACP synthase II [Anaerolineae bacterium]MBT4309782.1 beta-ketoacyl-ACP synthase II [Anaerolineae bacterium]MBT4460075.1 beta-ketoacyl-ACP synthase II [Anaerolineae bacterium]MBT4841322.1 beta-ketoacyl-ACP synthase II [Anaerolineae bacterium]MBT6060634.1 beta-ketoacyl-ACP synthase II [Anaerolineae bacterium]
MRKRVVITGLGAISPLGLNVEDTWSALIAGKSGAAPITQFDASENKTTFAAEVKGFDANAVFGRRDARRMDRYVQFALATSLQAVKDAGLVVTDENRDRIGVLIGTGIAGIGTLLKQAEVMAKRGPSRVSPFLVPMMLADSGPGQVAIKLGVRGPNMSVVTACATGSNSIGEAAEMIKYGRADVMIAGGGEASIVKLAMAGMNTIGALSARNDEPEKASRPFDKDRDGFVMGEGAGVLVLESLEHAQARGANILAELSGYGTSDDAYHISAPAEGGEGAALCMQLALDDAGLTVDDIGYINAHGTSTTLNDKGETAAIKSVFGEKAYQIPVSSTKSMTGHLLGASGALEAVFCTKALHDGIVPPTINYDTSDPECDLDYVPNKAREVKFKHALSNSFGFGGHNATLIISSYEE